jgi:glutamate 5-kinase
MQDAMKRESYKKQLSGSKRWVIKIGSALLTDDGRGLNRARIGRWVDQMVALRAQGFELILVSSGAVAEGMKRLGWKERPAAIHELQAAAAVGQMGLVQAYESQFQQHQIHTAQILLDHDDLANRERYLNARSTLRTLLDLDVIPVINENDTVVTDEIRFGDNDTLGALVANLVEADLLVILTDQQGLYEEDPRKNPDARLVSVGKASNPDFEIMAGGSGSTVGRGGMITKVRAAQRAARSGCNTVIAYGRIDDVLLQVATGDNIGTLLVAEEKPLAARKQWLAGRLQMQGCLVLDDGAVKVLQQSGRSLLAVGVKEVQGDFGRGALVVCVDSAGKEVARGLVNYSADEARQLCGQPSSKILELLGYQGEDELIHRDNLITLL